ncbi:MAG: DUF4838 domain-containing protein [Armatimonadetes bacterium]|nr:DUF4838 domain-containing protein [Armatimonadota bacterium]
MAHCLLLAAASAAMLADLCWSAPLPLLRGEGTTYVLYHDAQAPPSVALAAAELRDYLYRAAKAKLALVQEPHDPMICLGDNAAAHAAGLSLKDIPLEGFRVVTKGANLYILGPDTNDGELTQSGGTSAGTRNGVYAFLEKFVGVRWLMPGEHGDYVPATTDVTLPDTDLTDAPFFLNRRVPYTQEGRPEVKRWWARQRLGWSLFLNHSHNWTAVPPAAFDQHPDWFAERGGVRVPPTGRYKLCVTNPGLVRAFADAAIRYFDEQPRATSFSLSPADSAGWCECAECTKLYEKDPNGHLSITPAILTFYDNVAKLVAAKYPQKLLAGYVYSDYVFPPRAPIKLEPNVFLVWAPSFDYGFTLFRPALRQQAKETGPWPVIVAVEAPTQQLDVDAVQLEEGEVATQFHGQAASVRLVPAKFGSLFFPGDDTRFALEIENYADQPRHFDFAWRCRSLSAPARDCSAGTGDAEVAARASRTVPILPHGADRLGAYDLEVVVRGDEEQEYRPDGRFGRIQRPPDAGYDRLGINIHVGTEESAQLVHLLGVGWARIDWNWSIFEQAGAGKIDFTSMESWFTPVEKLGIKALPVLTYPPEWAKTADGLFDRKAHSEYVRQVAARFKGRVHAYDLWNEPESMLATGAQQDFWVEVMKGGYEAIKSVDPTVTVVGPSVSVNSGGDSGWTEALVKPPRSIGRYLDAWDTHTYPAPRSRRPELRHQGVYSSVDGLAQSVPEIRPLVKGGQLWVTEYGFTTCNPNDPRTAESARNTPVLAPWEVTEEQQANYLVRQTLLQLAYGIDRAFLYHLGPDGEGGYVEEQFGIARRRGEVLSPKVSFMQLAALTRFLQGAEITGVELPDPNIRVVSLERPEGPAKIAWAAEGEAELAVNLGPRGRLQDPFGNAQPRPAGKSIRLTEAPCYIVEVR